MMPNTSPGRRRRNFDPDPPAQPLSCQHPGCAAEGLYRAPRSRERLKEYLWFCLDHVRAYNGAWNYYAGMDREAIERATREAVIGERPTWPLGQRVGAWHQRRLQAGWRGADFIPEHLREALERRLGKNKRGKAEWREKSLSPEAKALAELDLSPEASWEEVKRRYKTLAKKLHPDANGGDRAAEERLKVVNQAYGRLKAALLGT